MTETRPLIAIVDDEESVRVALRRLCSASGLEARAFASAHQLFESLDQARPDCLVLDVHMPGLNGLETQLWLRERGIHIPSIMITGRHDETMRSRSIAAGACAYLCKPVDANVLIGAIDTAIRESHANISLS
ncbi:MAG TPA: response regulator [Gemmatimonadaceae bacterium]|jgi:FixJ family two-component response regulator